MASELTKKEKEILNALKRQPKGADAAMLQEFFPSMERDELVEFMNTLSAKQMVDFVMIGDTLTFKARDIAEVNKTMGLDQNERLIYNIVRGVGNAGIWIKDIKTKSNMHTQLVNTSIKNLEKKCLIKSIKSVRNPTKKLYMLFDLEPSADLTGGAWYTDQEFDLEFIEALSKQCYKYIHAKTFPPKKQNTIYPVTHSSYPTSKDVHNFIRKSGITPVDLTLDDVKQLLNRLSFDGKIYKRLKSGFGVSFDDQEYRPNFSRGKRNMIPDEDADDADDSKASKKKPKRRKVVAEDDGNDIVGKEKTSEQVLGYIGDGPDGFDNDFDDEFMTFEKEVEDDNAWIYLAVNNANSSQMISSTPCGKCPVFNFCSIDGPVNPMNCVYYDKWLEF